MKNLILFGVFCLLISPLTFSQSCVLADYPLDGNANDISGNGYNGTVNGATPGTDIHGSPNSAYRFDGVDDFIILNNNAPIITGSEFTIAAWSKIDGQGGGNRLQNPIFEQRDDQTSQSTIVFFAENESGNAEIAVRESNSPGSNITLVSSPAPAHGSWHHFAAVLGSDNIIRLYIDCNEVASGSFTHTGNLSTSVDFVDIGRHKYHGDDQGFFNGSIDELKLFYCGLDSIEINSLCDTSTVSMPEADWTLETVHISPNPSTGQFSVENGRAFKSLSLYNALGQHVFDSKDTQEIDLGGYKAGIYFVRFKDAQGNVIHTRKLIKH